MIRTRVGYAGGRQDNPDYGHIGDHTETVQVDYDPQRITYKELLDIFWQSHKPSGRSWSRQYMNAVFFHDDRQRQLAMTSKAAIEEKTGSTVKTEIVPIRSFTLAEEYHQKYTLKHNKGLKKEIMHIYPEHQDLVDSTAAARLNGYVGGYGSKDQLSEEIESLGLSDEAAKVLGNLVPR